MRACQVCGCASWGPIGNLSELGRLAEFVPDWRTCEFLRCDGCKSIARVDLLQDAPSLGVVPPPDATFPGIVTDLFKQVMPAVSAPPTRTERLLGAVLRAGYLSSRSTPAEAVALARALESALDDPASTQPWLVLSFPAREEFERWTTGFIDAVVCSGIEGEYTQDFYNRAVDYATKQS